MKIRALFLAGLFYFMHIVINLGNENTRQV
jgi:hypothetical protein